MHSNRQKIELARAFHAALVERDWSTMRSLLTDDATWVLPGDNRISGKVHGADAVVGRGQLIASYGLNFELKHILVSRENMALSLHNTAERDGLTLDEHLSTGCFLRDDKIAAIETYLSDEPGMDAFFATW